jgi:hypothetical protein
MRIIGYIEHPTMKITVFKMDDKRAIKFETGLLEQTYKFRAFEGFSTLEDIKQYVDDTLIAAVETNFIAMNEIKQTAFTRFLPADIQEEFEEII